MTVRDTHRRCQAPEAIHLASVLLCLAFVAAIVAASAAPSPHATLCSGAMCAGASSTIGAASPGATPAAPGRPLGCEPLPSLISTKRLYTGPINCWVQTRMPMSPTATSAPTHRWRGYSRKLRLQQQDTKQRTINRTNWLREVACASSRGSHTCTTSDQSPVKVFIKRARLPSVSGLRPTNRSKAACW